MPKSTDLESTNDLLRVIIGLMLRGKDKAPTTLRQQIEVLYDFGLKTNEIARIISRSSNYVNKEIVGIRKARKGKGQA